MILACAFAATMLIAWFKRLYQKPRRNVWPSTLSFGNHSGIIASTQNLAGLGRRQLLRLFFFLSLIVPISSYHTFLRFYHHGCQVPTKEEQFFCEKVADQGGSIQIQIQKERQERQEDHSSIARRPASRRQGRGRLAPIPSEKQYQKQ